FFSGALPLRDLHSFPTRRSSDLGHGDGVGEAAAHDDGIRGGGISDSDIGERKIDRGDGRGGVVGEVQVNFAAGGGDSGGVGERADRKSTRLNSSHVAISYAVFCL